MNPANTFPLVTIVVPVFNQRVDFLRQCIESVLGQDYPNLEVIISDNHSNNGSWEVIESFADPRLRVIRPPRHLPMVQHWAFATSHARGEYLSMMGSDDWAEPNWVSAVMSELSTKPSASFAYPNLTLHFHKTCEARPARDEAIPSKLMCPEEAARQVVEWTSHMFSWWIVGAIIRTNDYFAVSGIARYATIHNGDYPLSLGLLTRGDALYVGRRLVNYRFWAEDEGKSDGRRQVIILEDMIRILACIRTDPPVKALCQRAGWGMGKIRRRFIMMAVLWTTPLVSGHELMPEEHKRISEALGVLLSASIHAGILVAFLFMLMKLFVSLACPWMKRLARKILGI